MKDQHNDVHSFNVRTRVWKKYYLVTYPFPRDQHQICKIDDKTALLFGGFTASKGILLNDLWIFNYAKANPEKESDSEIQGAEWINITNDTGPRPTPRRGHTMISMGSIVYLFGGATGDKDQSGTTIDDNLYMLETKNWNWNILKTLGTAPCPRMLHCMEFYTPQQIVIFGGMSIMPIKTKGIPMLSNNQENEESCKSLNDLCILDISTMTYSRPFVANFTPPPRYGAGIASDRDEEEPILLIVGGLNTEYCYIDPFQLREIFVTGDNEWKLKEHHLNKERGETVLKESLRQGNEIVAQNNSRIIELEGIYAELLRQEYFFWENLLCKKVLV